MVHDAVLQSGGDLLLDGPLASLGAIPLGTAMNGLYVSSDFGSTWARMADAERCRRSATASPKTG